MIMTNVLLLNLLIARFNHIFDEVRGKSDEVWARQRCSLMLEYESKPPVPIPFSIVWRIFSNLCSCLCNSKCGKKKQQPGDDKKDVTETLPQDDHNYNCDTQMTDLNIPSNDEVVSLDYGEGQEWNEPPHPILPGQCNLSETASEKDGSCHDDMEAGDAINEEGDNDQQSEVTEIDGTSQDRETQLDDEDDHHQQTEEAQQPEHSGAEKAEQADTGSDREAQQEDPDVYNHSLEAQADDDSDSYDEEYYEYTYSYETDSEVCSDDDMDMGYYPSEEETETQTDENRRRGDVNLDEFEKANAELYLHERVN
ncbi:putative surface protein SACOL0050 [Haliotis rubra]|uniref:putative surface protein SACOL0050 n=1 Tax=Haliotis rubra TaxID=36100 RepID=UPI001EE4F437|nr:putative surface protein SACOL0050 [Haliotis rubra]